MPSMLSSEINNVLPKSDILYYPEVYVRISSQDRFCNSYICIPALRSNFVSVSIAAYSHFFSPSTSICFSSAATQDGVNEYAKIDVHLVTNQDEPYVISDAIRSKVARNSHIFINISKRQS